MVSKRKYILSDAARKQKKLVFILFLDKMVNTILSCEFSAGRRRRREMYGLTFFLRLRRWLLKQQPNKTVFEN